MVNLNDFTVITAVDEKHLKELTFSWQTWFKFKKEFSKFKFIVMYDADVLSFDDSRLDFVREVDSKIVPWYSYYGDYKNQREKMLSSLVFGIKYIETGWFIKIDTDTIAKNSKRWIYKDWFDRGYVFISNPWGYTKPCDAIQRMDDWADNVAEFEHYPRLDFPFDPNSNKVIHPRIISWLYFGNTEWTKGVVDMFQRESKEGLKLPVPSQDTTFFYVAKRMNCHYKRVKFKKWGWNHVPKFSALQEQCNKLLSS